MKALDAMKKSDRILIPTLRKFKFFIIKKIKHFCLLYTLFGVRVRTLLLKRDFPNCSFLPRLARALTGIWRFHKSDLAFGFRDLVGLGAYSFRAFQRPPLFLKKYFYIS